MSSLLPTPIRTVLWKCPKCGTETTTVEKSGPWIFSCLPWLRSGRSPVCPKCGAKMIKVKLFY